MKYVDRIRARFTGQETEQLLVFMGADYFFAYQYDLWTFKLRKVFRFAGLRAYSPQNAANMDRLFDYS